MTLSEKILLAGLGYIVAIESGIIHPERNRVGIKIIKVGGISGPVSLDKSLELIFKEPDGIERAINETIYFGVSPTPYAYSDDLKKAGVSYTKGKNPVFGHINKEQTRKMLQYLLERDGRLNFLLE